MSQGRNPRGRPRTRTPDERKTSVALDKELRIAIKRLQLHREAADSPVTMRELLEEGVAHLLAEAGLPPMAEPERETPTVVEITKRSGA
jgi:hypothetical protein